MGGPMRKKIHEGSVQMTKSSHSVCHSLTLSTIFLPNERENILVSSVCGSVGIKYSSQILQSCSKLGGSFRHSVSFQCLFKLRN